MLEMGTPLPNRMLTQQETAEEAWTAVDVRQAIRQQAQIARLAIEVFAPRDDEVLGQVDIAAIGRVYLTGCGDSYYAALAAKLAVERWTGLPTEVLPSMEFSRYSALTAGEGSLVVCLSNSGRVSRTIEAARVARKQGATVVAVTGRTQSELASSADVVLSQLVDTPDLPSGAGSLGLANYLVSLLALYQLAQQLGERNGQLDPARSAAIAGGMRAAPGAIEATFDAADAAAAAIAGSLVAAPVLYVLGAGPSLAAAMFGCAKLYEQPQFEGIPQELEEFAHLQYFMVTEGTPVLFVAPAGASRDRSLELLEAAQLRGGVVTAIGDSSDLEMAGAADHWLPLVGGDIHEELSPLFSVVPLELLADSITTAPNRPARRPRREVDPAIEDAFEFRRIYGSEVAG
jgi:glucosamine--fructose-6-phosphate aminotransferase (isomerizing)